MVAGVIVTVAYAPCISKPASVHAIVTVKLKGISGFIALTVLGSFPPSVYAVLLFTYAEAASHRVLWMNDAENRQGAQNR